MAVDRGTKGAIVSRWIGIFAGLGLVGATGYGAWEFLQQQGGSGGNPLDVAMAGLRLGVVGTVAGAGGGLVWGGLIALIRG